MTALTELKEIVNIESLQSAYYQDKFKLNLEETLNLLDKIEIEHMIKELTFYGKGFKIIVISNDEDYTYFEYVSTKTPKVKTEYIPLSLWQSDLTYSNEFKTAVPFKTQKMLKEEEELRIKEEADAKERQEKELNEVKENITTWKEEIERDCTPITDITPFTMIDHKRNRFSAYLSVPYLPKNYMYRISDENFLTEKERSAFDWIGYGTIEDGKLQLVGKGMAYVTKAYNDIYQNAVEELLEKKLIIPILGISPRRLRLTETEFEINECSTKEYINMVLSGIKNYYEYGNERRNKND